MKEFINKLIELFVSSKIESNPIGTDTMLVLDKARAGISLKQVTFNDLTTLVGGDHVDGPTLSVDNAIATYNGITGKVIQQASNILAETNISSDLSHISLSPPSATGIASLILNNNSGSPKLDLKYNETTNSTTMELVGASKFLLDADNEIEISTTGANDIILANPTANIKALGVGSITMFSTSGIILTTARGDDLPLFGWVQQGTNGSNASIYVGNRNPNGIISAVDGSIYVNSSNATSSLYINKSVGSTGTVWDEFGNVIAPASAIDGGLAAFDGTTGKLLKSPTYATFIGGIIKNDTTINTATYDLATGDYDLNVDYTVTGAVTSITLLTAQAISGREIRVTDTGGNASVNTITIDTEGGELISGQATFDLTSDYDSITLKFTGTNWFVK